jgi:hypothetical protein
LAVRSKAHEKRVDGFGEKKVEKGRKREIEEESLF